MGTEPIQCKFCGRSGDGVEVDEARSVMTCRYCGRTFSLVREADKSLVAKLEQWKNDEFNNLRILLIDTIRNPSRNTKEFIDLVQDRAIEVSERRGDDFLANVCRAIISTERGSLADQASGRSGILAQLKKCEKFPQDILGLILFIRRMEKEWPYYQKGLEDLYAAAKKFGIEIPLEGDHSGETKLPPVEEERVVFSQDVPEHCRMGDLTVECVVLDEQVTSIGESAFDGCKNLVRAELGPNVKEIGGSAFCGCHHLHEITIPASVKRIGACAFRGCGLTAAVFEDPNGWTAIPFRGREKQISAAELRDGSRAAGMLSKKSADGLSLENCEWYKAR